MCSGYSFFGTAFGCLCIFICIFSVTSNRKVCRAVNGKCKSKSADCSVLGSGFEAYSPGNCCGRTKCCAPCDAACIYEHGGNCVLESECNMIRNSSLCTSCAGLICCIPQPVMTSQWIGTYFQDGKNVEFGFTLTFDGSSITGQDSEGNGALTLDGTLVVFPGFIRAEFTTASSLTGTEVGYSGFLFNDGQTISGRWESGQNNGAFVLNRVQ
ncbi:uncharacterized protein LOC143047784 [Mytilus galloprovincialis]|uniref:uncharacterized protein LOC143047784 n=1 Tax=Mytilus galloprovincialis TaxID=29158 RepID=UPI003F7B5C75